MSKQRTPKLPTGDALEEGLRRLRAGVPLEHVAVLWHTTYANVLQWMVKADEPLENPAHAEAYRVFSEAVRKAKSDHVTACCAIVMQGVRGGVKKPDTGGSAPSPKLALNVLSRVCPDAYGLRSRQQLELTGAGGAPLQIVLPALEGDRDGSESK